MIYAFFSVIIGMTAGFENIVEADHVGLNICIWICNGVAYTSLCSEVYYDIWLMFSKDFIDNCFIGKVIFVEDVSRIVMFSNAFFNFF